MLHPKANRLEWQSQSGDLVFAVGPQGDIVGCDATTGKLLWQKCYTKDFGGSVPTWKYCESPLVDTDKLICTPGGRAATTVALNMAYKLNGQLNIPRVPGADKSWSHPVVAGGKLYLREQDSLFVY